jgi:hypothetical protein
MLQVSLVTKRNPNDLIMQFTSIGASRTTLMFVMNSANSG